MNILTKVAMASSTCKSAEERVRDFDWSAAGDDLDAYGAAVLRRMLTRAGCRQLAALYPHEEHFRSHIVMARLRQGPCAAKAA